MDMGKYTQLVLVVRTSLSLYFFQFIILEKFKITLEGGFAPWAHLTLAAPKNEAVVLCASDSSEA